MMLKKSVSVLLCVCLLLVAVPATVLSVSAASATILGDLNSDGKVNNRDLGMLQQHLNGWDVTIDALAADVNADDKLNNRDYGLLQQYLNGWDVPNIGDAIETPDDGFDIDKELEDKDNFFEVEIGLN